MKRMKKQEKVELLKTAAALSGNPQDNIGHHNPDYYISNSGRRYVRVSKFLRDVGFAYSQSIMPSLATLKGTAAHTACLLDDIGALDRDQTDQDIVQLVHSYNQMKSDTQFTPIIMEYTIYSDKYGIAGTIDRAGLMRGKICLLDIKTGTVYALGKIHPSYKAQIACYYILFRENFGFSPDITAIVNIAPKRYVLHELSDIYHVVDMMEGALKAWNWFKKEKGDL